MFEKFGRIFDAKEKYPMNIHNSIPPVWNPWNPQVFWGFPWWKPGHSGTAASQRAQRAQWPYGAEGNAGGDEGGGAATGGVSINGGTLEFRWMVMENPKKWMITRVALILGNPHILIYIDRPKFLAISGKWFMIYIDIPKFLVNVFFSDYQLAIIYHYMPSGKWRVQPWKPLIFRGN